MLVLPQGSSKTWAALASAGAAAAEVGTRLANSAVDTMVEFLQEDEGDSGVMVGRGECDQRETLVDPSEGGPVGMSKEEGGMRGSCGASGSDSAAGPERQNVCGEVRSGEALVAQDGSMECPVDGVSGLLSYYNEGSDRPSSPGRGRPSFSLSKEALSRLESLRAPRHRGWDGMFKEARTEFFVRGKTYMTDGIKILPEEPVARLVRCDLFKAEKRTDHIVSKLRGTDMDVVGALRQEVELLVLNFQLPGTPSLSFLVYLALPRALSPGTPCGSQDCKGRKGHHDVGKMSALGEAESSLFTGVQAGAANASAGGHKGSDDLMRFGSWEAGAEGCADDKREEQKEECWLGLLRRFVGTEDKGFRDSRFKIIPSVVEGPWPIQLVVGNRPALLGNKVNQLYFRGDGYLEISADISSSMLANYIFTAVKSSSVHVVLDLSFLVQGESEEELPERLIGGVRLSHVDLNVAEDLPITAPFGDEQLSVTS